MPTTHKQHIILLFFCFLSPTLLGQHISFSKQFLSFEKEIPFNVIHDIEQDEIGQIWLASSKGVSRFDGYFFEHYKHHFKSEDPTQIASIFPESSKRIWLFSRIDDERIKILDLEKDSLVSIDVYQENLPFRKEGIRGLFTLSQGSCMIFTSDELFKYDGDWKSIPIPDSLYIRDLLKKDVNGGYWAVLASKKFKDTNNTNHLYLYHFNEFDEIDIVLDQSYFSKILGVNLTNSALFVLVKEIDSGKEKYKFYRSDLNKDNLNFEPIFENFDLDYKFQMSKYWLSHNHQYHWLVFGTNQLVYIDGENEIRYELKDEIQGYGNLKDLKLVDRRGNLWISSDKGILIVNPYESHFDNLFWKSTQAKDSRVSTRSLFEFDDHLWISSYSGVLKFDLKNNKEVEGVNLFPKLRSAIAGVKSKSNLFYFYEESPQMKIFEFDPLTEKIREISSRQKKEPYFSQIAYGPTNNIWLGHWSGGLYYIPPKRDSIYAYQSLVGSTALDEKRIKVILEKDNYLYLGSSKGLGVLNLSTKEYSEIEALSAFNINHIHQDNTNCLLWIATDKSGLLRYDQQTNEVKAFNTQQGFYDSKIYSIQEDELNNLWIGTHYGLVRFNKENEILESFFECDGISNNEFNLNSYYSDSKGWMYFGGINGVTRFHPDTLESLQRSHSEDLSITSCFLLNFKDKKEIRYPLEKLKKEGLILPPDNVHFSMRISPLNFTDQKYNYYEYRIPKVTKGWVELGASNLLKRGITPGRRQLEIRAKLHSGYTPIIKIPIIAHKEFYKRDEFFGLLILLVTLLFFLYDKRRNKNLIRRNETLEGEVASRTLQLKNNLQEKEFLFKEMHHRVKNNLSILKGLLFLQAKSTDDERLKSILANCERRIHAMAAVHSKFFEESLHPSDQKILLQDLAEDMTKDTLVMYEKDDRQIRTHIDLGNIRLNLSKSTLLLLIYNELVTNSIKHGFSHKTAGYISISGKEDDSHIYFQYIDDGSGLAKVLEKKVMDQNGFGLKLIKLLMDQLDGELDLELVDGYQKGTLKVKK